MNDYIVNDNALSNELIVEADISISSDTPVLTDTPVPTDTPVLTDTPIPTDIPLPTDTPTPYVTLIPVLDDSEITVEDEVLSSEIDSVDNPVQVSDDMLLVVHSLDTSLQRTNYLLSAILFFVIFWWLEEKIFKSVRRLFINAGDH